MEFEPRLDATEEQLVAIATGCAQLVFRRLGPGRRRTVYVEGLVDELARRRLPFQSNVKLPVVHRGVRLDASHLVELFAFGQLMIDVVAGERALPAHCSALRARLRLTGVSLGIIATFGSARDVLSRVVVRQAGAFCLSHPARRTARPLPIRGSWSESSLRQDFDDRNSSSRGYVVLRRSAGSP